MNLAAAADNTPEGIPPRDWSDIVYRVFWSVSADRVASMARGVAFFALLSIFPGIAALFATIAATLAFIYRYGPVDETPGGVG